MRLRRFWGCQNTRRVEEFWVRIAVALAKPRNTPSPRLRRAVRGKYPCNVNLCGTPRNRVEVVLRGLDPRIHVFVSTVSRRTWPGHARPRRNWQANSFLWLPLDFSPDSPSARGERAGVRGNFCSHA